MADAHDYEGHRNSLLSPSFDTPPPPQQYQSYNNSNSGNGPSPSNTSSSEKAAEDNFGDLLAQLLRTLPTEASTLFLKSLSGLSPGESSELCKYVSKLAEEKQYRVIRAMAESTVDGKKKFIANLRAKFAAQQAKEQVIQVQKDHELEEHMKRKEALSGKRERDVIYNVAACANGCILSCVCVHFFVAVQRIKKLNATAQFHSSNAVVGTYVCC